MHLDKTHFTVENYTNQTNLNLSKSDLIGHAHQAINYLNCLMTHIYNLLNHLLLFQKIKACSAINSEVRMTKMIDGGGEICG